MLICIILWAVFIFWTILCFTVLKDSDKDWHIILFWALFVIAVCSIPVWLFIEHPFYYWLLCRH